MLADVCSIDDVYRMFGEAAEGAQLLETELGNILMSTRAEDENLFERENRGKGAEILEKINRSTLGWILKELRGRNGIPDDADRAFANALAERNRLMHVFYREHNFRRNSSDGCKLMVADLRTIDHTIMEAYAIALKVRRALPIVFGELPDHLDLK